MVAIAVVLAVAAAAAVILYTQGVKEQVQDFSTVIVSTQEIPANQRLDPLIEQGVFDEVQIPPEALIDDAVTDITQLQGATAVTTILANEQISVKRLSSSEDRINILGIERGHLAVSMELDSPQGGNSHILPGDNVAVFATYQNVQFLGGDLRAQLNNPASTVSTRSFQLPDFTVTLIPSVRVLAIENPAVDTETGQTNQNDSIRVTLDLLPEDAQRLVFAKENGLVWLGLLHPEDESGHGQPDAALVPVELLLGRRAG
ncbi:MAG TPA: Flp pilus assembly protein CpaB [Actinomycetota bacterium]|nr:Flp pilus assembly protein CpaB [Actinomycetota bacterium]